MIYIILIAIIISYICNDQIYKICNELPKTKSNTIIIYILMILSMVLTYQKYGITQQSVKYLSLIPFIIIISIIDYHTTYIYDITILSGIIIQCGVFLISPDVKMYITALLIGIIIPYILAKITKGLGEGDIGLYGLCCFALGKNYSIYLIFLSFILASIYCVYILLTKGDKIRKIPFAPFISLATILIILTNFDILNIWFNIISN
ncbi:MAG: prepilin peptidase [Romboutsia sp.]|uniref:Prepilin type IV leader peptidase n=2 Tax=Peptostreptococcaceae TaxID=186804 RepID=A0A1V1HXU5_9FIRM|nr:prepilin peptidase [Romboutsia sp.]CED92788.1 Prepilin type IV leader peptidase [Romboutsia ilealis]